jgi:DNA-directed RNA polymerase alpha subunit
MLRDPEDRSIAKADQKTLVESIEKMELSGRTMTMLQSLGVSKMGDLMRYSDLDLYRAQGGGQSIVQEISTALGAFGLYLNTPEVKG